MSAKHSATTDGLTTVLPDQFLTAEKLVQKNVAAHFTCVQQGILPGHKVSCKLHQF